MDYIKLLPPNIHEEIIKRVPLDKPFDVTICEGNDHYTILFKRPSDVITEIDDEFDRFGYYNSNSKMINININEFPPIKEKNIFIGKSDNFCNDAFPIMIFNGNQKVYFFKNEYICLTKEANDILLQKFKEWLVCSICQDDNKSHILHKTKCCLCRAKLKPAHYDCFTKCKIGVQSPHLDNKYDFLCDDCIKQCDICKEIYCKTHISFCELCDKNICPDHKSYCYSCSSLKCEKHHDRQICKNL